MFRQREIFNILVSERRPRQRELRNKGQPMREFDTVYIVVLINQVKSSIKYGVYHQKLLFKTKGPYRVLYKAKPGSLCLQNLHFLGGIGKPGINAK